jgi:carbamoyltransferase
MPIVETPEEALHLFEITALDILVIENYVIEK